MRDNWSWDKVYNVKMNDLTRIIDNALNNGYTVAWATDVSEKYFSWKNGVAFVPEKDWEDSPYRHRAWEESVKIIKWIHDIENGFYEITYQEI